MNPQHTVPVLVDDGFVINESRAALMYLARKYGEKTDLFPQDPKSRSMVEQRLFFDQGNVWTIIRQGLVSHKDNLI